MCRRVGVDGPDGIAKGHSRAQTSLDVGASHTKSTFCCSPARLPPGSLVWCAFARMSVYEEDQTARVLLRRPPKQIDQLKSRAGASMASAPSERIAAGGMGSRQPPHRLRATPDGDEEGAPKHSPTTQGVITDGAIGSLEGPHSHAEPHDAHNREAHEAGSEHADPPSGNHELSSSNRERVYTALLNKHSRIIHVPPPRAAQKSGQLWSNSAVCGQFLPKLVNSRTQIRPTSAQTQTQKFQPI